MKLENGLLTVTKEELITIIKNNPDNESDESKRLNKSILEMIEKNYGRFTPKQSNWVLSKVKFIFRSLKRRIMLGVNRFNGSKEGDSWLEVIDKTLVGCYCRKVGDR
jgi:hypothetical protein